MTTAVGGSWHDGHAVIVEAESAENAAVEAVAALKAAFGLQFVCERCEQVEVDALAVVPFEECRLFDAAVAFEERSRDEMDVALASEALRS